MTHEMGKVVAVSDLGGQGLLAQGKAGHIMPLALMGTTGTKVDAIGVLDFNEMLRWAFDPGSQPPGPGPPVRGSVRVLQSAAYASARSILGSHRVGNRKRGWRLGERLPSVRERRRRLLRAQGHVECLLAVEPGGQKPFTEVAVARAAERSRVP